MGEADLHDDASNSVSAARLESVLDTAVDGILVINERAQILVYNRACESLFGYAPEEALGRNVRMIMPSDYAAAHDGYMHNYMTTGHRKIIGIGREVRARHKDGTEFPVELSVGETITPEGRQFIGIIRDLRPRKEQERRVNELQADLVHMARVSAMDEMGAALAHELNQPLTAIMLYLQAANRSLSRSVDGRPPSPDIFRQVLEKAVHEAERAGGIISRMRQFVEKREPQRRQVDLNAVVEEAVELTMLGLRSEARLETTFAAGLPPAVVDPIQVPADPRQPPAQRLRGPQAEAGRHRSGIHVARRGYLRGGGPGQRPRPAGFHHAEPVSGLLLVQAHGDGPRPVDLAGNRAEPRRRPHRRPRRRRPRRPVRAAVAGGFPSRIRRRG